MAAGSLDRLGLVVNRVTGVERVLEAARQAEDLGYGTAWLTNGGPEDCMPLMAAIASRTKRIRLGTSVVQTYPRHPAVLASEANVIDQLAPGRLRLGVGPSHEEVMAALGIPRSAPLDHLREYVSVLRSLASGDPLDFKGSHYQVRSHLGRRLHMPVMVGALQPKTFELAGRESDGAITWLCPAGYIASIGIPCLERGALEAGRPRPPIVAHVAACVHDDADEVREAVRTGIPNIRFPSYQRMLIAAGFAEAAGGVWTDALVDRVVAWGRPEAVVGRIEEMFAAGADEVLIRPLPAGPAGDRVVKNTIETLAGSLRRPD